MLPVHIIKKPKDKEPVVLPPDGLCYLVGSNGIFQRTVNPFYEVTRKLESLPGLGTIDPRVRLHVRKLPYHFVREAAAFFASVYKEHQSEAIVLLYCHPQHGWHMDAPQQSVHQGSLHVNYEMKDVPTDVKGYVISHPVEVEEKGVKAIEVEHRVSKEPDVQPGEEVTEEFNYSLFGTIHSHAAVGAFHSGTDDNDEKKFDGLHITIGNVNVPAHTYSSRWVLAGEFYKAEMHQVAEDPPEGFFDERWLKRVTKRTYTTTYVGGASGTRGGQSSSPGGHLYRDGSHYHGGGAVDHRFSEGTPMDTEMAGWWPAGAAEGGAARDGGTFQGKGGAGKKAKGPVTILPDGRGQGTNVESGTPEKEARLRTLSLFMGIPETKHQRNYFERLDRKWKDFLIQDLVEYHPIQAQSFLAGVGVVLQKSTNGGSDASSQHAAEKTESTTSQKPNESENSVKPMRSCLPPPATVTAAVEDPVPAKQPEPPKEEDYLYGAFE